MEEYTNFEMVDLTSTSTQNSQNQPPRAVTPSLPEISPILLLPQRENLPEVSSSSTESEITLQRPQQRPSVAFKLQSQPKHQSTKSNIQTFESIARERAMSKLAPEPMVTEVTSELSQKQTKLKLIKTDPESSQKQSKQNEMEFSQEQSKKNEPESSQKPSKQKVFEDVEVIEIDEDSPPKLKKQKSHETELSQKPSKLKVIEVDPESSQKHKKPKVIETVPESSQAPKTPNLSDKIFKIMETENCPLTSPAIIAKVGTAYDKKMVEKLLQEQVTEGKLISKLCGKMAIYCVNNKLKAGAVSS
jgi:TBPIP/Hop2 winged helix domain